VTKPGPPGWCQRGKALEGSQERAGRCLGHRCTNTTHSAEPYYSPPRNLMTGALGETAQPSEHAAGCRARRPQCGVRHTPLPRQAPSTARLRQKTRVFCVSLPPSPKEEDAICSAATTRSLGGGPAPQAQELGSG